MNPSGNHLIVVLILLIILGIVLQGLLTVLAHILPWLALGLAATAVIAVTVRVFVNRRNDF